jgi:trans-2,3-dihydro-3-hydroxyanthranilate isomerase
LPLSYLHYDVFTDKPFTGNQLAVFLDGRGLSAERMQALAREMNFSESTFILPAETSDTDVRMRIFTPATEMPMAGHPTIGSTFALAHTGVITPGASRFVFGLGVGPVAVDLEWQGDALHFAWMTQRTPTFGPVIDARPDVAAAIGLTEADLMPDRPVREVSCGVPFLLVPIRSREAVDRAVSDAAAFRRFTASTGLDLPIFFFSRSDPGAAETVHSRMFAPEFGIIEDPATGSASGPLGCYLLRHGLLDADEATRITSLQGAAMGRPSRIHVSISSSDSDITQVKVGGRAVLVAQGELFVPEA